MTDYLRYLPNIVVLIMTLILWSLITLSISKFLQEILANKRPHASYNFGVLIIITILFLIIYIIIVVPFKDQYAVSVAYFNRESYDDEYARLMGFLPPSSRPQYED